MSDHVLIVCDMQNDLLKSIPASKRLALLDFMDICLSLEGTNVIYTGVRFSSGYPEVNVSHKIYGGFRRLNEKVGDAGAHWFLEGYEGSEVIYDGLVCWRSQHCPGLEILEALPDTVAHATIVGIKAAYAVQAIAQLLCDRGIKVQVVKECIADDTEERTEAILTHLLPIYAEVVTLPIYVHQKVGLSDYRCELPLKHKYFANCGRAGHFFLFQPFLTNMHSFPTQYWYDEPLTGRTYNCPLGRRIVDFCDEPQFSKISMYIKGREWLDEKDRLCHFASDFMPLNYCWDKGTWQGDIPTEDTSCVWFLKEANKNGGRAVQVCGSLDSCIKIAESTNERYVVQPHVPRPALYDDKKCHLKFYCYMEETDGEWKLFTYSTIYLSTARGTWSPTDTTLDCQISTFRDRKLLSEQTPAIDNIWSTDIHESCQKVISEVIAKAVGSSKIESRGKKQFEIFSVDFLPDQDGKVWLIEFNFTPVLFDPVSQSQELTTKGLREYARRYQDLPSDDPSIINDHNMIKSALELAFDTGPGTGWSFLSTHRKK